LDLAPYRKLTFKKFAKNFIFHEDPASRVRFAGTAIAETRLNEEVFLQ
jgi:hypothetical protein